MLFHIWRNRQASARLIIPSIQKLFQIWRYRQLLPAWSFLQFRSFFIFEGIDWLLPTYHLPRGKTPPKISICVYTFAPMCKCRWQFWVFALKISSVFSVLISFLTICTYFSWKNVITDSKILICAYRIFQKLMVNLQIPNLRLYFPCRRKCKLSNL